MHYEKQHESYKDKIAAGLGGGLGDKRYLTWEEEQAMEYMKMNKGSDVSWLHEEKEVKVNKYNKTMRNGVRIDVYEVLDAFGVDNPAMAHAVKKILCAGQRGYKDYQQDIQEAIDSLERAKSFPPIPF